MRIVIAPQEFKGSLTAPEAAAAVAVGARGAPPAGAGGCGRVRVGRGGGATNDGGAGMAQALGVRFLDGDGGELPPGGAALARLARIDASGLDPRLAQCEVVAATDVMNPLCGPEGGSLVDGG